MPTCGTGLGNFPAPGDPNLNSPILSVQVGEGGIFLSWTYPSINPEAVAHTLLYRNTENNIETAWVPIVVTGTQYFDNSDVVVGTVYYYWIQMVSVNGTVGDVIGPVSATMQPPADQIVALLLGRVADSELNSALKTRIDQIDNFAADLLTETGDRETEDGLLTTLIAAIQSSLDDVDTLVISEIQERIDGDTAIVVQVDAIAVVSGDNAAAITAEAITRANADGALSITISNVSSVANGNTSAISNEVTARTNADTAISQTVTTLTATVGTNTGSISTLDSVVIGPNGLEAIHYVKTDVNGYVAGFGLYNTGSTSSFIVHADLFAVGKAGETTKILFAIGEVNGVDTIVLNAATFIEDGTIQNLMIGNYIQSTNWNPTTKEGWQINKSGDIQASSLIIYDSSGNVVMNSGGLGTGYGAGVTDGANVTAPGISAKANYINFSSPNNGELYIHGFDSAGNPANIDGYIQWNGAKKTVPKGSVWTGGTTSGWLMYEPAGGAPFPHGGTCSVVALTYQVGTQWKYDQNGSGTNFTPSSTMIIIGTVQVASADLLAGVTIWESGRNISSVGAFTNLDQITPSNASTYIADLAVDTLQIADQAVTIPSAAVAGSVTLTANTTVDAIEKTFTSTGAPCQILYTAEWVTTHNGYILCQAELHDNSGLITTLPWQYVKTGVGGPYAIMFQDTPPAGSVTYEIKIKNNDSTYSATARRQALLILETKK